MTNINIYDSTYKIVRDLSYSTGDDMAEILEEAVIEYAQKHVVLCGGKIKENSSTKNCI